MLSIQALDPSYILMLRLHRDNTVVLLQGANIHFLIQERDGQTSLRCSMNKSFYYPWLQVIRAGKF